MQEHTVPSPGVLQSMRQRASAETIHQPPLQINIRELALAGVHTCCTVSKQHPRPSSLYLVSAMHIM